MINTALLMLTNVNWNVIKQCYHMVTSMLQQCYIHVTTVLHQCYNSVTSMLQQCYNSLQQCYNRVATVLHQCYISIFSFIKAVDWRPLLRIFHRDSHDLKSSLNIKFLVKLSDLGFAASPAGLSSLVFFSLGWPITKWFFLTAGKSLRRTKMQFR